MNAPVLVRWRRPRWPRSMEPGNHGAMLISDPVRQVRRTCGLADWKGKLLL